MNNENIETSFELITNKYVEIINNELSEYLKPLSGENDLVREASKYSIDAGGKRLRPIIALAFADMFNCDLKKVLPFACSIEMIHTFSLIHDDLPGMDNDDFRRGQLTCHKKYSEATAILAGDYLLNRAYEIIAQVIADNPSSENIFSMVYILKAVGGEGMIGGQMIDVVSENKRISLAQLEILHKMKTGALIKAPAIVASKISGADLSILDIIDKYADSIGLAFQIKDDILDVNGESNNLGKTTGKDAINGKSTYVTLLGLEHAKILFKEVISMAFCELNRLNELNYNTQYLNELTKYLLVRDY